MPTLTYIVNLIIYKDGFNGGYYEGSKHFNFHKLWLGQSISLLGTQFTIVALPLFALEVLQTSEANAAMLRGVIFVPYLIFGLVAGALIDIFIGKMFC